MTDRETASKLRGMIRRVTLKNIRDDGEVQTASVEIADGVWRDDVEIMQQFGVSSVAAEDGAVSLALAIGSDEGDLVVLPPSNPSQRMGGLKPGEIGISNGAGDRIVVDAAGNVNITSAASVSVKVGGITFTVTPEGVDFGGGYVRHNGVDIGDTHIHRGVVPGGGNSGTPV